MAEKDQKGRGQGGGIVKIPWCSLWDDQRVVLETDSITSEKEELGALGCRHTALQEYLCGVPCSNESNCCKMCSGLVRKLVCTSDILTCFRCVTSSCDDIGRSESSQPFESLTYLSLEGCPSKCSVSQGVGPHTQRACVGNLDCRLMSVA